jgi:hypothetical protein
MPVLHLLLWLFHDKRNGTNFDHGILHYIIFHFLLLLILTLFLIDKGMLYLTRLLQWNGLILA